MNLPWTIHILHNNTLIVKDNDRRIMATIACLNSDVKDYITELLVKNPVGDIHDS
jgi:hypothetical protein